MRSLPWIRVADRAPYFVDEQGRPWHPIGHNDAITWPDLSPLFRRKDVGAVQAYFDNLSQRGVTVLRLMLEYSQVRHRYFEKPVGVFPAAMIQLWDDLFSMAEKSGVRLLITPFDTFWTWLHWRHHPYNRVHGGPLDHPSNFLLCGPTRRAIKNRLEFVIRRWGGSGAFFAWDLWNEIHPAHAQGSADCFPEFISDLSTHVRGLEQQLYGRTHPQTVSLFGPELDWKPHMPLAEPIFRHPDLDFASVHIYRHGTIDNPRNTIAAAADMGKIVRAHTQETPLGRPFFDSEHGPIHSFKDRKKTLSEDFDDEYFRHMQWAHLAAGGAGGGMRWPNRNPHALTAGMGEAQRSLAAFMPEIEWRTFRRKPLIATVSTRAKLLVVACGDENQAILYLLRAGPLTRHGLVDRSALPVVFEMNVPGLRPGPYTLTAWDTVRGVSIERLSVTSGTQGLLLATPAFVGDLALAIKPAT
ncbi:MAG: hypothetical protein JWM36_102 [Hyphomicrobiales bacterium]|nr:hypothetical protein [Hyphomicrobiales bacterium]